MFFNYEALKHLKSENKSTKPILIKPILTNVILTVNFINNQISGIFYLICFSEYVIAVNILKDKPSM